MVSRGLSTRGRTYQVKITVPRLRQRMSIMRLSECRQRTHELFCLRPSDNVRRDTLELPQRRHRTPPAEESVLDNRRTRFPSLHSTFNHLAQRESALGRDSPCALQTDLVDGTQDTKELAKLSTVEGQGNEKISPSSGLLDIDHVGNKGEALEFQLGDKGLQQDINLGGGFLHTLLDWDRYTL